jgi:hypothetical protein
MRNQVQYRHLDPMGFHGFPTDSSLHSHLAEFATIGLQSSQDRHSFRRRKRQVARALVPDSPIPGQGYDLCKLCPVHRAFCDERAAERVGRVAVGCRDTSDLNRLFPRSGDVPAVGFLCGTRSIAIRSRPRQADRWRSAESSTTASLPVSPRVRA